jgi:predicted  nucleic acid-binding Zn-ribbon protein
MSGTLESVIALQSALDALRSAEAQLADVPDWMRELHEEYSERKAEIDVIDEEAEAAAQDHRTAEAEAEDARAKLKHYQEQIGAVRTQREYAALLQEIDTSKEQIRQAEAESLEALERQEEANGRLEEARQGFADLETRYSEAMAKWETEKPGVEKEAETLRGTIETIREQLPRQVVTMFDRIHERHDGDALATVREVERPKKPSIWCCSACNYRVRPQSVVVLRRMADQHSGGPELILCDSCRRILHLEEVPV